MRRAPRATTNQERIAHRFTALSAVATKIIRIVSGNNRLQVTCVADKSSTPGWSDGRKVYINTSAFPNITDAKTLVRVSGLVYHELSHILYTPRIYSNIVSQVRSRGHFAAMNALEDQRIETLFVAQYRSAAKYFTEMVIGFLMQDEESWKTGAILTHGRRFLPLVIRNEFEKQFAGTPQQLVDFKRIIDEYRVLDLTLDTHCQRALPLIEEYHNLTQALSASLPQNLHNENGQTCCEQQEQGDPSESESAAASRAAKQQTEEQDAAEEDGEDASGFYDDVEDDLSDAENAAKETDEDSGDDGDDPDSDSDAAADGADGADGDEEDAAADESNDSESGDASGDSDSDDADSSGGDSAGSGSGDHDAPLDEDSLRDLLDSVLDDITNSNDVQEEVRNIRDSILRDNNVRAVANGDIDAKNMVAADVDLQKQTVGMERELLRLKAMMEPNWRRGSDTGRVNIGLAMHAADDDTEIFDEWDEGQEHNAGTEVVILCDYSGSMCNMMRLVCQSLWSLKRAFDRVEAKTTVMVFGHEFAVVFNRDEQAEPSKYPYFPAAGGTNPTDALIETRRILSNSEMPNKFVFIVTDGDWQDYQSDPEYTGGGQKTYEIMDEIRRHTYVGPADILLAEMPATTVLIGIGKQQGHGCDVVAEVGSVADIVPIIKNAVTASMKQTIKSGR